LLSSTCFEKMIGKKKAGLNNMSTLHMKCRHCGHTLYSSLDKKRYFCDDICLLTWINAMSLIVCDININSNLSESLLAIANLQWLAASEGICNDALNNKLACKATSGG
jgi:hypothetical protein